ncbi:MAG: 5'-nucleotidase C-terminal domain-containing protein [Gammaproteobacteria bacterium]
MKPAPLCAFALLLLCLAAGPLGAAQPAYQLTLLHTNDTHSHHEPQASGEGGTARQAAVVKQIRATVANTLLVDAGDRFTGTLFHKYYAGKDNIQVMNALGYDAMTLGNHEFDNGVETLAGFVGGLRFPVVVANLDVSRTPLLAAKIAPSTILWVGGEKIGLIGLITADTPEVTMNFAGKQDITWHRDYAARVNAESQRLQAQGVNKIILITHIGLSEDQALAAQVSGVDVIVGGHSHTLLSNTFKAAGDNAYPTAVNDADGNPLYIVQAGDRNRYLGRLDLEFDAQGKVTRARGDTILLSEYIAPDPAVQTLLARLAEPVNKLKQTALSSMTGKVVTSEISLTNADCRTAECLLGDLIADAMRADTGAQIAIQNGGGIRADIDPGPVTIGEVLSVLPFGNTIATFKLRGADLKTALENGVSRYGGDAGSGRFPQVSGMRLRFDPGAPAGARITSIDIASANGSFTALDPAALYTVATNNFMRTGGDGYGVFVEKAIDPYDYGRPLEEALIDYLIAHTPLNPALQGRISQVR